MKRTLFLLAAVLIPLAACSSAQPPATNTSTPLPSPTATPEPLGPLTLTSTAFADEGNIAARYGQKPFSIEVAPNAFFTCENSQESQNISPALSWTNVPPGAKSLALIMGDQMNYAYPESPADAVFPHWIVYNIPPSSSGLPEGGPVPAGSLLGVNGYPAPHDAGYGGPCPGPGEKHLYILTLYALDTLLDLPAGAEMDNVKGAMEGHILAQTQLKGYYTAP